MAPGTKLLPWTIRVKPAVPAATDDGTTLLTKGTGLSARAAKGIMAASAKPVAKTAIDRIFLVFIGFLFNVIILDYIGFDLYT